MSMLSIHKALEKKDYEQSELGQMERKLREIYDGFILRGEKLPENISKQIYDLRDQNEKDHQAYIEMTLRRDKQAVDDLLHKAFTKELEILNNYLNQSTTK